MTPSVLDLTARSVLLSLLCVALAFGGYPNLAFIAGVVALVLGCAAHEMHAPGGEA